MTNKNNISELLEITNNAQESKKILRTASKEIKDSALQYASECINRNRDRLIKANLIDMEHAKSLDLQASFIDRLKLDDQRIDSMISGLNKVINLNDPVGELSERTTSPSGFYVSK